MLEYLANNWLYMAAGFYFLEKLVLITPVKWDDILVSGIFAIFKKLTGNT